MANSKPEIHCPTERRDVGIGGLQEFVLSQQGKIYTGRRRAGEGCEEKKWKEWVLTTNRE